MKIAITGASGFVGSHLVWFFSSMHEVIALQRHEDGYRDGVHYISWDIRLPCPITLDMDICIHAAADTRYTRSYGSMFATNVAANRHVVDSVNASSCRHFIYVSSSSVYQGLCGILSENARIDEKNLRNSYSASKYLAEKYIRAHLRPDIRLTILRPRAIYGEGDRLLKPTILRYQCFGWLLLPGNGSVHTSLTSIKYFVEVVDAVIACQKKHFALYNVSDPETRTLESVYRALVAEYGLRGIIHIPLWILWLLRFVLPNRMSYLMDTFGYDKILSRRRLEKLFVMRSVQMR